MRLESFIGALMRVPFRESCQCFGPAQRGPLTVGIARSLAPGRQQIDTLLGFSIFASKHAMHIETVGASVDLGSTNLHQLAEARLETGGNGDGRVVPILHE